MKIFVIKLLATLMLFGISSLQASAPVAEGMSMHQEETYQAKPFSEMMGGFLTSTGINALINPDPNELNAHGKTMSDFHKSWGRVLMILITFVLFYLAIKKGFEPLLLLPIAFGGLLANIPVAGIAGPDGFLGVIYNMGLANEMFPIIIFMGVGAMTDFGPLLSNPKTALLGGAAQFGIFGTLVGAVALSQYTDIFDFTIPVLKSLIGLKSVLHCLHSMFSEGVFIQDNSFC